MLRSLTGQYQEGCLSVVSHMSNLVLKKIAILHADVHGAELEMVQGADRLLSNKQVNWVFVSTHSEQLHVDCVAALRAHSRKIVASHTPDESFSVDGLERFSDSPCIDWASHGTSARAAARFGPAGCRNHFRHCSHSNAKRS